MTLPEREAAPNFASLAALIGEPARASMLWSLMDGQSRPAGELARIAGLSAQAASAHLAQLVEGGLLLVESRGRYRFFRLASAEIATTIESLAAAAMTAGRQSRVVSLVPEPLRTARRCYGHLAGKMGVQLHDTLVAQGWILPEGGRYVLSDSGRQRLAEMGIDFAGLKPARRGIVFACNDWSERRPHLGGPLAHSLLNAMISGGWFTVSSEGRQLYVTPEGRMRFERLCRADAGPIARKRSA